MKIIELEKYVELYGNLPKSNNNPELLNWYITQKLSNATLTNDQIILINKYDSMHWQPTDHAFQFIYNKLKQWLDVKCTIPNIKSLDTNEKNLALWVDDLKLQYKYSINTELDNYLINSPEWLLFIKDTRSFNVKYEAIVCWITDNKKFPKCSSKNLIEKKWGYWCATLRKAKKNNKLTDEQLALLEQINGWFWAENIKIIHKSFTERMEELKLFLTINNRLPSPSSTLKDKIEQSLGWWCSAKRSQKKENKLTKSIINELETIKYWYWDIIDPFIQPYQELCQYITKYSCLPKCKIIVNGEDKLASWCSRQKIAYKNNNLSSDRTAELEKISVWTWSQYDLKFENRCKELLEWVTTFNKHPISGSIDKLENSLAKWCCYQRLNKLNIHSDRIKKLEQINGWTWSPFDDKFNENYEKVKLFIEKNNKLPFGNSDLGEWCTTKRSLGRRDLLSYDRYNKLNQLKYWQWDPNNEWFDEKIKCLNKWVDDNHRIPSEKSENTIERQLGKWCTSQRRQARRGTLDSGKIAKLELITGWYWEYVRQNYSKIAIEWLEYMKIGFGNIQTALSENGEFNIPNTQYHADGYIESKNMILEFYGDYWHGNPKRFKPNDLNHSTESTFGELYQNTIHRKDFIISFGYKYIDIWESDWKNAIKTIKKFQLKIINKRKK